ncbi:MAG: putative thymidylate kinase [Methanoregula sp. PtaU1.Bin051]|nr:MAG: putative thymidylate kinase [Methanoregula sp. PtaU1.Bin051]
MLITLEGIDGTGKSTLAAALATALSDLNPVFTREPGATWVGDSVRRAIAERADPVTEALLFVADHAAHLAAVVRPALAEGRLVISDRYTDSRYAYQQVTLDGIIEHPLAWLHDLHNGWTVVPDKTFLFVVPIDEALNRLRQKNGREHFEERKVLEKVQENYLELARADPSRFVIVDAMKEREEICSFVAAAIRQDVKPGNKRRRKK